MRITKSELRDLFEPLLAHVKAFVDRRDAKAAEALASMERRLSRHAEHLARLESRLKALETK